LRALMAYLLVHRPCREIDLTRTPARKVRGLRARRGRQAIGIPRRTAGVAAESHGRLHRDALGGENEGNGSCRSHRRERRIDDSSIQSQRRCFSLSLHRPAARRTRMHDDEYDARGALPDCDRVRNVRPGASQQSVSPHDRYELVGLAPGAGHARRGQA
jgi:hypothetical protein